MKRIIYLALLLSILAALISGLIYLIPNPNHLLWLKKGLEILLLTFATWVLLRLLNRFIWPALRESFSVRISHLFVVVLNLLFVIGLFFSVTIGILGISPASIITASGLVTAGLAIALQGIIGDVAASIIIDLDRLYKIGDWIRIDDYTEGKVTDIGWRHTEILTLRNERLIVNNGKMLTTSFHNLGQSPTWAVDEFLISVGHDIPSHRVQRVVETALQKHPESSKYYTQVLARTLDSGGVNYYVRYGLADQDQRWQTRHSIIEALRTELHAHGLRISEGLGEYGIFRGNQPLVEQEYQDVILLLSRTELLKDLSPHDIKHLSTIAQELVLPAGIQIIHSHDLDQTLYLIGEGTVEVVLPSGDTRLLYSLDYFGEQGFLIGDPRNADVYSKTPVILYKFTKESFSKILKDKQNILRSMIEVMTYRSRDLETAIQASKQKSPQETWEDIVKRTINEFFKG